MYIFVCINNKITSCSNKVLLKILYSRLKAEQALPYGSHQNYYNGENMYSTVLQVYSTTHKIRINK